MEYPANRLFLVGLLMMRETRNNQERESIVGETVYKQTLLGVILNHPRHSFKFLFKQNRYEGERITNSVDRIIKEFPTELQNYKTSHSFQHIKLRH